jgi:hypothetical protein
MALEGGNWWDSSVPYIFPSRVFWTFPGSVSLKWVAHEVWCRGDGPPSIEQNGILVSISQPDTNPSYGYDHAFVCNDKELHSANKLKNGQD